MNSTDGKSKPVGDAELLDRLVDDELDEPQRQQLLAGFDQQPDGWRRCALAFLEAQTWKRAMRAVVRRPAPQQPVAAPSGRRWFEGRGGTALAVAASFLLALGLGTLLRDFASPRGGGPDPSDLAVTADPRQPSGTQPGPAGSGSPEQWQLVNLGVHSGPDGGVESVQLPACQRDSIDEAWLDRFPQAMPEQVERALQRTGHEVRQSRQFVPLRMKDGRQLLVPVDQVDVHYVGNQPYQ